MSDSDKLKEAHNQGQTDASNDVFNLPHGVLETTIGSLFISRAEQEKSEEENDAYREGHEHAESQKSSCFLTTACTQAAGFPDDCNELTTLRNFRDTFILGLDGGDEMVRKYYELSPRIVEKLSADELQSIYATVQVAVAQIGRGEFKEAFSTYAEMFDGLCAKHLGIRA